MWTLNQLERNTIHQTSGFSRFHFLDPTKRYTIFEYTRSTKFFPIKEYTHGSLHRKKCFVGEIPPMCAFVRRLIISHTGVGDGHHSLLRNLHRMGTTKNGWTTFLYIPSVDRGGVVNGFIPAWVFFGTGAHLDGGRHGWLDRKRSRANVAQSHWGDVMHDAETMLKIYEKTRCLIAQSHCLIAKFQCLTV